MCGEVEVECGGLFVVPLVHWVPLEMIFLFMVHILRIHCK